jgi:hypothetical protein
VLYVPNFLNESLAEELKLFCISGDRFIRSSIGGYGDGSPVQKHHLRTRYVVGISVLAKIVDTVNSFLILLTMFCGPLYTIVNLVH